MRIGFYLDKIIGIITIVILVKKLKTLIRTQNLLGQVTGVDRLDLGSTLRWSG